MNVVTFALLFCLATPSVSKRSLTQPSESAGNRIYLCFQLCPVQPMQHFRTQRGTRNFTERGDKESNPGLTGWNRSGRHDLHPKAQE